MLLCRISKAEPVDCGRRDVFRISLKNVALTTISVLVLEDRCVEMRDDFSEDTKRTVAERVNRRCSYCYAQTSGPQVEAAKSLNVGVAAHITAAANGGPRYNPTLTPEERKHPANAIWLCQTCAKLVDNDAAQYPEALLRRWKADAETNALNVIGQPFPSTQGKIERSVHLLTDRVEEIVGLLTEALSPGWLRGMTKDQAIDLLNELEEHRGKLRKHSNLLQALRDYENTVGWLLRLNGSFESKEERTASLRELEEHYQAVIYQVAVVR